MRKKLYIFDFDGTLVDTIGDIAVSINHMLAELKKPPLILETVTELLGLGLTNLISRVMQIPENDPIVAEGTKIFETHYTENCTRTTVCYPGVEDFLKNRRPEKTAILTNKGRFYTIKILRHLGLEQYFDMVLSGDELSNRKPDPEGVFVILDRLGCKAGQAVMVGDSTFDIEAGIKAGVATVGVTYGYQPVRSLKALGPDHLIDSFPELEKLFPA